MAAILTLAKLDTVLKSTVGRDKVAKIVHYGSRGVAGLLTAPGSEFWHKKFRKLFVTIMEARRCNRWLSSLGVILALRRKECPWGEDRRLLFVTQQLSMVMWNAVDHIRWLQKATWLPGDEALSRRCV